ncbi:MAG: iron(III) transport system ATP-binding protein, partial [Alphaproteobacteria bacterium]
MIEIRNLHVRYQTDQGSVHAVRGINVDVAEGEVVYSSTSGEFVPPYKRDIGMVFQSSAIWPHMTVFQNAAFPQQEQRPRLSKAVIREKVRAALAPVQLEG